MALHGLVCICALLSLQLFPSHCLRIHPRPQPALVEQQSVLWLSSNFTNANAASSGRMTMWSGSSTTIVGSSCEYANSANGGLKSPTAISPYVKNRAYCAADDKLFKGGANCGACYRVRYGGGAATDPGRAGSLIVQIVDSGSAKTFDCHLKAFQKITGARTGIFPISYTPVSCLRKKGGAVAMVLDGNNAYYTKVIFSNLQKAVRSASMTIAGSKINLKRAGGATWSANTGGKKGKVTFSLKLTGGSAYRFSSCFSSWPVRTGSSCRR